MGARIAATIAAALLAVSCTRTKGPTLTLAGFSVCRNAYEHGLLITYGERYQQWNGRKLRFRETFDGSGAQMRAIKAGLRADVAALSLAPEIDKLVKDGLVDPNWNKGKFGGIPATSLVVLGVRPGNPKHIRDWRDLTRADVEVVMPNPSTSGSAKWNMAALYGSMRLGGSNEEEVLHVFRALRSRVKVFGKSGRESMQHFLGGIGDVVVTYECEIVQQRAAANPLDIIYPARTISIELPVVAVHPKGQPRTGMGEQFVQWLDGDEAQTIYALHFFRPANHAIEEKHRNLLPYVGGVFRAIDIGGWKDLDRVLFSEEGLWNRAGE
jgi:sulfate/thiosulfate transport system substrate-binding protein